MAQLSASDMPDASESFPQILSHHFFKDTVSLPYCTDGETEALTGLVTKGPRLAFPMRGAQAHKQCRFGGFFRSCCTACRLLVPPPGIEPMPPAVEAWSLNRWAAREVPVQVF